MWQDIIELFEIDEYHINGSTISLQRWTAYEQKKSDIMSKSDQIVTGILKKTKRNPECAESRQRVLNEVIDGIKLLTPDNTVVTQHIGRHTIIHSSHLLSYPD